MGGMRSGMTAAGNFERLMCIVRRPFQTMRRSGT